MRIGFIGAGRMGFTLGKHLVQADKCNEITVEGYYSQNTESARQAAEFTDTKYYDKLEDIVANCDALFLTVPDGQIAVMVDRLGRLDRSLLEGKILCHTSGAMSSQVFSDLSDLISGYSIHPMYAVSSKLESYRQFHQSFITIEGDELYLDYFKNLFELLGHEVCIISAKDKAKYHAAAVCASNLVIGMYNMAAGLLKECGFDEEKAQGALAPLFINNANSVVKKGVQNALTGPVDRCDISTIEKHLNVLDGDAKKIYALLSNELIDIALSKNKALGDEALDSEVFERYSLLRKALENGYI